MVSPFFGETIELLLLLFSRKMLELGGNKLQTCLIFAKEFTQLTSVMLPVAINDTDFKYFLILSNSNQNIINSSSKC